MMRALFVLLAFLSLFLFPYPYTVLLSLIASLYLPFAALVVGVLADILYFSPLPPSSGGLSLPVGTLLGALLSVLALFVRRFVKTRIID